ncbi:MAG: hypothetical protein J0L72_09085 [Armatimonadetes bacterium]|nr:hypothetical protein [Armatimonadota bacterium]
MVEFTPWLLGESHRQLLQVTIPAKGTLERVTTLGLGGLIEVNERLQIGSTVTSHEKLYSPDGMLMIHSTGDKTMECNWLGTRITFNGESASAIFEGFQREDILEASAVWWITSQPILGDEVLYYQPDVLTSGRSKRLTRFVGKEGELFLTETLDVPTNNRTRQWLTPMGALVRRQILSLDGTVQFDAQL